MANENVITTEALIGKFKYALDNEWGYIWGTAGIIWTEARQQLLEQTTDPDRENGRKYGRKWIGHMVADCSGLFTWAFKALGGRMYHGSNTMYLQWCTNKGQLKAGKRTDGQELLPGTAVFVWNSKKKNYSHVGLYIGGGTVIEAKGTQAGVITSALTDKKWTNWGQLKGVQYGDEPIPETKPTLRKGSTGPYVVELQQDLIELGYNVGKTGADGKFGENTEKAVKEFQTAHDGPDGRALAIDGIVGDGTWWALNNALDKQLDPEPEPGPYYTVTIEGLTEYQAGELLAIYPGAKVTKEA